MELTVLCHAAVVVSIRRMTNLVIMVNVVFVMVKVKQALKEKHNQQTQHDKACHVIYTSRRRIDCVREQVKNGNAQQDPGDKTHHQLGAPVRQTHHPVDSGTEQYGQQKTCAVKK